jgi:hypothetical protein
LRAKRSNLVPREIASAATQVGLARLGHELLPISGKPKIGGRLAMTPLAEIASLRSQ